MAWIKELLTRAPKEPVEPRVQEFLAKGTIENLVAQNRLPVRVGEVRPDGKKTKQVYQVPPEGYDPRQVDEIIQTPGSFYTFVFKDGSTSVGDTYWVTPGQARQIDLRVRDALHKLRT